MIGSGRAGCRRGCCSRPAIPRDAPAQQVGEILAEAEDLDALGQVGGQHVVIGLRQVGAGDQQAAKAGKRARRFAGAKHQIAPDRAAAGGDDDIETPRAVPAAERRRGRYR